MTQIMEYAYELPKTNMVMEIINDFYTKAD